MKPLSLGLLVLGLTVIMPSFGCGDASSKERLSRDGDKKKGKKKKKKKRSEKSKPKPKAKDASLKPLSATPDNIAKAMLYLEPDEIPPEMQQAGKSFADVRRLGAEMCQRLGDPAADALYAEASKRFAALLKAPSNLRIDKSIEFKRAYKCLALSGGKGCGKARRLYETADSGTKNEVDRIQFNVDWMSDTLVESDCTK